LSYQGEEQMRSLSKVYQGGAEDVIQRMEFRDLDNLGESENGMFIPSSGVPGGNETPESSRDKAEEDSESSPDENCGLSRQEVESIREEVYEQGRQEGVEEGYSRGKQEGRQELQEELDQTVNSLVQAMDQLNSLRSSLLNSNKQDMVRLVRIIAEQVIHVEVCSREKAILRAVEKAIQAAIQSEEYRVRVNPQDMEVVTENKPLFLSSIRGLQSIVVEPDEDISRGGCVVESDQGKVDATIESKLEKIQDQLYNEIANEES